MKIKYRSTYNRLLLASSTAILITASTHAATRNWDGDTSTAWGAAANWDTLPVNNTTTDIANFNLASYGGNPVFAPNAGTTSINGITIGASNGAMTITTTNITIGGSGITIANGAGTLNVSGTVTVGAPQTWTNNDNDTATFGVVAKSNALALGGSGKFLFNGSSTGTGNLTINSGTTLEIGSAGKAYSPSYTAVPTVTVGSGATLIVNNWNWDTAGGLGTLDYGRGRLIVNGGTIEYKGTSTAAAGRNFTVGTGGATLKASSAAGTWLHEVDGGTGNIQNNTGLTLDGAYNGEIRKIIEGTGSVTKSGAGTWTLNGLNTYTGTTAIGAGTLSAGKIDVSGGNSHIGNASSAVTLGSAGAQGTLSYTGNSAIYTRGFTIGGAGGGRLDVTTSGQTLTVDTGSVTGSGLFTVGGAGNTTISTNLTHTGGLTKTDAGTLTISGAGHTFAGTTSVSQGALIVNGNISTSLSTIVASGSTLGGSGTLGATTISGTHSPGNSPGIISHSSLTYEAGSNVVWELVANSTADRGTNFDGINLTGSLAFNGDTTLDLIFNFGASAVEWQNAFWASDYTGTAGWLIYSGATSLTGFSNLDLNDPVAWLDESGDILASVRPNASFSLFQNGNSIYLNYTAIPEPGASLLGCLGLLALLRRRRA